MPVREFTDDLGRRWRAWDISPEAIEPVTRGEDYLADCFVTGWIVFETLDGTEKRRLCPWPMHWMDYDDDQLRELLGKAELTSILQMKPRHTGSALAKDGQEDWTDGSDVEDPRMVRTFLYPGGRFWSVWVVMYPADGGLPVLRYQAGARWIDLRRWPRDWPKLSDADLIALLRQGAPRRADASHTDTRARRWDDQREGPQQQRPT